MPTEGPPEHAWCRCTLIPMGRMTERRTYDVNRDLWVWSRGGKPFFVTSLDPHGPFAGYLHILLRVARRQSGGNQLITGGLAGYATCHPL